MRLVITTFVIALSAGPLVADTQAADACKDKLSPIGQQIYTASLAHHPTPTTGRDIVKAEVEKLIGEGKIGLSEGRSEGEAAGACLKLLK